jgi:membrane-associated phospholipid phosphatase
MHVAEDGAPADGALEPLQMSDPENMEGWDSWVRASLYLTDFLLGTEWTVSCDPAPEKSTEPHGEKSTKPDSGRIKFATNGKIFITIERPPIMLFNTQLARVRDYMDQRNERSAEILTQLGYPIDYFATILGLNAARNRYTFELIAITQVLASHVAMVAKHHLACRRPDRLGPTVMPMIPTPGHGTFPSAHATEAFAVATVLEGLLAKLKSTKHYPSPEKLRKLVFKQAERIAVNRTVAGMHFPIDTWAGAALGEVIGQIILAKCSAGQVIRRTYSAEKDVDFAIADFRPDLWRDQTTDNAGPKHNGLTRREKGEVKVEPSPLFGWLWTRTVHEFEFNRRQPPQDPRVKEFRYGKRTG